MNWFQTRGLACCLAGSFCLALILSACAPTASRQDGGGGSATSASTNAATRYVVKGVLKESNPDRKRLRIRHEEIPGYMMAMTMEFEVRDASDLKALKPGDPLEFVMWVTDTDGWISDVRKVGTNTVALVATNSEAPPKVEHYQPLMVGDRLPDFALTNQLGAPVVFSQFKGQAFAFTFFFTTCPFPTMCPRMSNNLKEVYEALSSTSGGPTNWHLFSITIDPQIDKPSVLRAYAENHGGDAKHWTYLTGEESKIEVLGKHFGLNFFREGGALNHNLRTVVVGPDGVISKIFVGNEWKSSELTEELRRVLAAH